MLGEAWRNLVSGTTRAIGLALALALGVGAPAVLDLVAVGGLQDDSLAFEQAGAAIRTVTAEGLVVGEDCDRLAESEGVTSSGAIRAGAPITVSAVPDDPIPSYLASPGLAAVLGVRTTGGAGVWVPDSLASLLGVTEGSILATTRGPMRVAGRFAYPEDGRDARLGYAIVVPERATARFDECWAQSWPGASGLADQLRWAGQVVPGDSTPMTIGQLNNAMGPIYDPGAVLDTRVTRWGWLGSGVVGLSLGYVAARRRRLEYASALHAGQARAPQVLTALVETMVWVSVALTVAACVAVLVAGYRLPEDHLIVLLGEVPAAVAGGLGAILGVVAGVVMARERHLFAYFKDR